MNRTPVEGRVTRIEYRPGKFLPAYKEGANDNELNEIWIDHHGAPSSSGRSSASWRAASSAASSKGSSWSAASGSA